MKNQRYNLLTTIIVSSLHPNEPQQAGTKWEPTNAMDIQEADALCEVNYAEKVEAAKGDTVTPTWLQRQDAAKKQLSLDSGMEPGEQHTQPQAATATTSTDKALTDEQLGLILEGSVDNVRAELGGLTQEQLDKLWELEDDKASGGKQRKGVFEAINEAIDGLNGDQE